MNKLIFKFLLRNKVRYQIVILLFLGTFLLFENTPDQYGTIYSSIVSSILYTVYFEVINRHKNRLNLLYQGNKIKQLKKDTVQAISVLSLSFFLIAAIIDWFLLKTFLLSGYYLVTLFVFVFSTLLIPINIEKPTRKNNTIITFKEGFKVIGLGISLLILSMVFLQLITQTIY